MFEKLQDTYNQFPRTYWVVVGTHFIDVIGNTLLNSFFALYVTQKFNVGMTQAGIILATNSVAGIIGRPSVAQWRTVTGDAELFCSASLSVL